MSTKADLDSRLQQASSGSVETITLGGDLTAADPAHDALEVSAGSSITLDLAGKRLYLQQLTLSSGSTLDVVDTVGTAATGLLQVGAGAAPDSDDPTGIAVGDGAVLEVTGTRVTAFGSDAGGTAGIGSAAGTTGDPGRLILKNGAIVTGQGGKGGSGIGGAQGAAALAVSVTDSRLVGRGGLGGAGIGSGRDGVSFGGLTASSTVDGPSDLGDYSRHASSIDGAGGRGAAGIGGGLHAVGGDVRLDGNTDANVSTSGAVTGSSGVPSVVGAGQAPTASSGVFGTLRVGRYAWLWANNPRDVLTIPADATVRNDGSIRVLGGVVGDGTIVNHGAVSSTSSQSPPAVGSDPAALISVARVTGDNFVLRLHPGDGTLAGRGVVQVFCAYLDSALLVDAVPARQGWSMLAWNTRPDGTGDDFSGQSLEQLTGDESADGDPVVLDLYARYGETPRFTTTAMPSAGLGRAYDQPLPIAGDGVVGAWISAVDDQGAAIPTLPAGLTYDAATRRVRGTPTEAGAYRFRVVTFGKTALDGYVTLIVAGAPTIAQGALPSATVGVPYSAALSAVGIGTVRWTLTDGALPEGLTLSADGTLSGTPLRSGVGGFTVQAADEYGRAARSYQLDVAARPASAPTPAPTSGTSTAPAADAGGGAVATPSASATATVGGGSTPQPPVVVAPQRVRARFGHPFALSVRAASLDAVTYTMRGELPTGVTLDPTDGLIQGIPAKSGTFTALVTATTAAGEASTAVTLVVPERRQLIEVRGAPRTWVTTRALPITVQGLRTGERFQVLVDGRLVQTGRKQHPGAVKVVIRLGRTARDATRHVEVVAARAVADPATIAAASFDVTLLAPVKTLRVSSTGAGPHRRVVVKRLMPGERVQVTVRGATVAKGHADGAGEFSFLQRRAGLGTHSVVVTGGSAGRRASFIVTNPRR